MDGIKKRRLLCVPTEISIDLQMTQSKRKRGGMATVSQCHYWTRAVGRKRVAAMSPPRSPASVELHGKRILSGPSLESLPQDILIRILCLVNHSDVGSLLIVSKMVREAALIAKTRHFAFKTPVSKPVFRDFEYESEGEEAPNAPARQGRTRTSDIDGKHLGSIALQLFFGDEEEEDF